MKVLFSALSPSTLRNFESVVRLLGERGHEVRIVLHGTRPAPGTEVLLDRLRRTPGVGCEEAPVRASGLKLRLTEDVRASLDLLHFLDSRFHATYATRALRRAPRAMNALVRAGALRSAGVRNALSLGLRAADRATPASGRIRRYLAAPRPDVVLFTPYIGLRTIQPDYLRAAKSLGVPSGVCVASWDNLTGKSLMRPLPDRVFVWNETQRAEAAELHGVPPERVAVTGAQCFDDWFTWRPRPREELCRRAGIDPERPFVLYACFTPFVHAANQDEVGFVGRWLERVRASGERALAGASVVVRPHPKRVDAWRGVDLSAFGDVVVWPRDTTLPIDAESRADYFDSLVHSAAVVGLNSTALLEAGIAGRPVLTVLAPEFRESQEETLHFRYLLEVGGGLLRVSRSLDEHVAQLADAVAGRDHDAAARARRFVEAFIRPHGLDVPATPIFVDEIEALAAAGATSRRLAPASSSWGGQAAR